MTQPRAPDGKMTPERRRRRSPRETQQPEGPEHYREPASKPKRALAGLPLGLVFRGQHTGNSPIPKTTEEKQS